MAFNDLDESNPYRSPDSGAHAVDDPGATDGDGGAAARVIRPLARASGWITFAGVLMIIYGGMAILTIVGAVIGWLPLWMGILLTQAATRLKEGVRRGDVEMMREGSDKLRLVAKIWGITTIVVFALTILFYGALAILIASGVVNGRNL